MNEVTINQIWMIYLKSRGTNTLPIYTVAVCPVLAVADLLTGFPVKPRSTCLVAVESRPTRFAGALARHGVTAGGEDKGI